MEIKVPKGTIIKVSGSPFQLKHSMYVEIMDEKTDRYIGRLIEGYHDTNKAGSSVHAGDDMSD
jgi:hypothetical protein